MSADLADLDTISSSVAFAFLASTLNGTRTVPLVLTPFKNMGLRPENELALKNAYIPAGTLLHPEGLPVSTDKLAPAGVRFDLVDHNRLLPVFGNYPNTVDAIIDHHEDEGVHPQATSRLIKTPTGSCSSLVTKFFMPQWKASLSGGAGAAGSPVPPELATLLLSSILIDTQGLKKGGKAMDVDYESASFLYPLSTLATADPGIVTLSATGGDDVPAPLSNYSEELVAVKYDVTGMSTDDLLLRDYKQYEWTTNSSAIPKLDVGLSTVPLSMAKQLKAEPEGWKSYMANVDKFMAERGIDIEGVLTTFKSETKHKGRRELLLVVRPGLNINNNANASSILHKLGSGLLAQHDLFALEDWGTGKGVDTPKGELAAQAGEYLDSLSSGRVAKIWNQGNHHATRKQVAPAMHDIVSGMN